MTASLDKRQVVGTLAANFSRCVDAMVALSKRRGETISLSAAEEIVAEALWAVPLRLALLKSWHIVDEAILTTWLTEFRRNKEKRMRFQNAH